MTKYFRLVKAVDIVKEKGKIDKVLDMKGSEIPSEYLRNGKVACIEILQALCVNYNSVEYLICGKESCYLCYNRQMKYSVGDLVRIKKEGRVGKVVRAFSQQLTCPYQVRVGDDDIYSPILSYKESELECYIEQ